VFTKTDVIQHFNWMKKKHGFRKVVSKHGLMFCKFVITIIGIQTIFLNIIIIK